MDKFLFLWHSLLILLMSTWKGVVRRLTTQGMANGKWQMTNPRCPLPQLPEVETVVREVRPELVGRRIVRVKVGRKSLRQPWSRSWTKRLLGQRVRDVQRRGKWIVTFLQDDMRLVFHLGMTGQLRVVPA